MAEADISTPVMAAKMIELKGWVDEVVAPTVRAEVTVMKACMRELHKAFGTTGRKRCNKATIIKHVGEMYAKTKDWNKLAAAYEDRARDSRAKIERLEKQLEKQKGGVKTNEGVNDCEGMLKKMDEWFEEQKEWRKEKERREEDEKSTEIEKLKKQLEEQKNEVKTEEKKNDWGGMEERMEKMFKSQMEQWEKREREAEEERKKKDEEGRKEKDECMKIIKDIGSSLGVDGEQKGGPSSMELRLLKESKSEARVLFGKIVDCQRQTIEKFKSLESKMDDKWENGGPECNSDFYSKEVIKAIREQLKDSTAYCDMELKRIRDEVIIPYLEESRQDREEGKGGVGIEWGDIKNRLKELDGGMKGIKGAIEETKERMKGCEGVVRKEAMDIREQIGGMKGECEKVAREEAKEIKEQIRGKSEECGKVVRDEAKEIIEQIGGMIVDCDRVAREEAKVIKEKIGGTKKGCEKVVREEAEKIKEQIGGMKEECVKVERGEDPKIEALITRAEELVKVTKEIKDRVASPTYAEVLSAPKPVQTQVQKTRAFIPSRPNHAILISSKAERDSSNDILEKVKSSLDARETGIRVNRVTKVRDCKLVISCDREDELDRVKEMIGKNKELVIEQPTSKDPLVKLVGLLKYNKEEDIIKAMLNQNGVLWEGIEKRDFRVKEQFRKGMRNDALCISILRVAPVIYGRMMEAGFLHIDLQQVKVQDQSPLRQCTKCLGFGHGRRHCTEPENVCCHCGGKHMKKDCVSSEKGESPACRNCALAGVEGGAHNAFNEGCPIKRKWDAIARAGVGYPS